MFSLAAQTTKDTVDIGKLPFLSVRKSVQTIDLDYFQPAPKLFPLW